MKAVNVILLWCSAYPRNCTKRLLIDENLTKYNKRICCCYVGLTLWVHPPRRLCSQLSSLSWCLFVRVGYAKSFHALFVKLCMIINLCYGNNSLNSGVDPTQSVWTESISDFCYNTLHITYFHRHSLDGTSALHMVRMHHVTIWKWHVKRSECWWK